jgi:alcohol dehydrogenase, propanol-preferring
MKAIVLQVPGPIETQRLGLVEVDRPGPGPGQLLIRVTACGVCRSNLHMIEGDWPGVPTHFPMIPGHEVVGRVEEVGDGVDSYRIGDRVGVQPLWSTCLRCVYCLSGREQLCRTKQITGESVDGGYAEYMVADATFTYPLPQNLDDAASAALFCPGITAYGSVVKARLTPAKSVAVFGVGGAGHLVIQMARLYGSRVVAVARSAIHLELAEELGADQLIDASRTDPGDELVRLGGVDASIVFAPSDIALRQAVIGTKPGGVIVTGVNGAIERLIFADEKTIVGSILGTRQQMHEVLAMAAAGMIHVVHEQQPLSAAQETLGRLKRGEIRARAILVP